jgi:DNA polymerase III subunit gamma/tau
LGDVAGQKHITDTLKKALSSDRISHAYLFTGPRGVGKTSVARILAHEINGLEYNDDSSHIDIIEIDAASNRRIDEIRDLRERVYISPSEAKYKVYIIDEVHMLTREAFNALLKTLEEPPAHVVFILATTDAHKLPATIISRTQRYNFKPIDVDSISSQLNKIAKAEEIKISEDALQLLAEHSEGSLRDAESLLDQARSQADDISEKIILDLLGLPPQSALTNILELYYKSAPANVVMQELRKLYDQGYQASVIASELCEIIRKALSDTKGSNLSQNIALMKDLLEVPASFNPDRYLEVTLLMNSSTEAEPAIKDAKTVRATEVKQAKKLEFTPDEKTEEFKDVPVVDEDRIATAGHIELDPDTWNKLLDALKKQYNTLYGMVKNAKPTMSEDNTLVLGFSFELHRKKLNDSTNQAIVCKIMKELTGKDIKLECYVDKSIKASHAPQTSQPVSKTDSKKDIESISNIFSGAEVIES